MSAFSTKSNTKPKSTFFSNENGNDAFFGAQAKLNIGKSNDKYEVEADQMADKIVSSNQNSSNDTFFSPSLKIQKKEKKQVQKQDEKETEVQEKPLVENSTPLLQLKQENELINQRKQETIKPEKTLQNKATIQKRTDDEVQAREDDEMQAKEKENELQMSASADASSIDNSNLESNLNSTKGSGSPLPETTKTEMESGFGADFSNVRIHNNANAVQMNKELGSQAFASGNDVYFNEGKYNPNSQDGKHLLAHELTHTVQQGGSSVKPKMIQKEEATASVATPATSIVEITSLQTPTFTPSEAIATQIEGAGSRGADINVSFGEWASGTIKIKKNRDGTYNTKDTRQSINLN